MTQLTPEMMIYGYSRGLFPMAEPDEENRIYWWLPERRALLPIEEFHVPRRLARTVRQGSFAVRIDHDFDRVVAACADRDETWLSTEIIQVFQEMFDLGLAHSVAAYRGSDLVGGVYGLALGRAFFAESMFSRARDASKVALVGLVDWLRKHQFELLDIQFMTDHLLQFGAFEIDAEDYQDRLDKALRNLVSRFD